MSAHFVRPGLCTVSPYLILRDAQTAIDFMVTVFGAVVKDIHLDDSRRIVNAHINIGDSSIEVSDTHPEYEPSPAALHIYVQDVDAVFNKAIESGADPIHEPKDMDYGERGAGIKDPSGNTWWIATFTGL